MLRKSWIYIDKTGFNLSKARKRSRNIIGHGTKVNVPGQREGNITLCTEISQNGVLQCYANVSLYNRDHILTFLDTLHNLVIVNNQMNHIQHIIIWDNMLPCSDPLSKPNQRVFLSMTVEGLSLTCTGSTIFLFFYILGLQC